MPVQPHPRRGRTRRAVRPRRDAAARGSREERSFEVRTCTADDFDQVYRLLRQLWPRKRLSRSKLRAVYDLRLDSPFSQHLCVTEGDRLVGFAALTFENSLWMQGRLAIVEEFVVEESYRGRGIGTRLLEAAVAMARARGARRVELDSATHRTEAHAFYRQRGFENRGFVFSKPLL